MDLATITRYTVLATPMCILKMASGKSIQGFVLKGVTLLNRELGRGAYGKVYAVKYCQTVCAAKEIHSILIEDVGETERRLTIESFLRECRQCSTLRHPNVIQFLRGALIGCGYQ